MAADIKSGHGTKAAARAAVAIVTCASVNIPIVGPFISVGLGLADAIWGEQFYDWVENEF